MTKPDHQLSDDPSPHVDPAPVHAAADWRDHDLLIRKFHRTGLVPGEIAVILNSKGLRVKTWAVSETFVRNRLKALALTPNTSRVIYAQGQNLYRLRPAAAQRTPR